MTIEFPHRSFGSLSSVTRTFGPGAGSGMDRQPKNVPMVTPPRPLWTVTGGALELPSSGTRHALVSRDGGAFPVVQNIETQGAHA
jgi:hypothetical protein